MNKDDCKYDWKINRREFIKICGKTALISLGIGLSGCIGGSKDNTDKKVVVNGKEIKFITIGDPHVRIKHPENRGNERLAKIVDFVNKSDVDFVVILGDLADSGQSEAYDIIKNILKDMKKKYYSVIGNHDIFVSREIFESYHGPMEHIENVNGYQLLFIGMYDEKNNGVKLHWSFDFNKANKNMPTIVFMHGPVVEPPSECTKCNWGKDFFGYGQSMKPELDKFSNLIGVYSGHVHFNSDQTFNGVRHITLNGLMEREAGGIHAFPSDEIGYTTIKENKIDYKLVKY